MGGGGDSGSPGDPILATLLRVETAREGRYTRETPAMIFRNQQSEKSKMIPGNPMWVCCSGVESLADS